MSKKNVVTENVVMNAEVVDRLYTDVDASVLKNAQLVKSVKAYASEVGRAKKSMWKMAYILADVVSTKTYKDDFATDKEFAKFMGISPAALSKTVRVARLKVNNVSLEEMGYGRVVAEELLPLEKKGLLDKFFELSYDEGCPDPHMNRDAMRASVKAFINAQSDNGTEDRERDDQSTEEGIQGEQSGTDSLENYDDTDGDTYRYTLPVFNKEEQGVEVIEIEFSGYDAMERVARAIAKALDVEVKKGTVGYITN